ncbi:MAG: AlpA family transcriptional regulator [Gemmatimonadetes bacterium]|nr:AlpA family transcriptional regulator [Gemmatimonadota bacterium]MYG16782.1 AlpA family transcriptional regulator [Gemmatimonadota bacterium]
MSNDRFVTVRDVLQMTHLSRTTIYRLMAEGIFPKPIKVGLRAVRWKESEVQRYIERCPRAEVG